MCCAKLAAAYDYMGENYCIILILVQTHEIKFSTSCMCAIYGGCSFRNMHCRGMTSMSNMCCVLLYMIVACK